VYEVLKRVDNYGVGVFESVPKESGRSLSAYDHAVTVSLCG